MTRQPVAGASAVAGRQIAARVAGAVVGGSLSTVAAALSFWLNLYWWSSSPGPLALLGIAVGVVLGFIAGPEAIRTERPVAQALGLAFKAALLGFTVYCVASLVASSWSGTGPAGTLLVDISIFLAFVLPTALIFALPATIPIAFSAVCILRLGRLRRLGVATTVVAAILSSVLAVAVPGPNLAFDGLGSAVQLQWTVANHSTRPLELGVFEHHSDGFGGSLVGIEPCFTSTGHEGVGRDWFLTLEPDSGQRIPPDLVAAADAQGSEVAVWVEIAPDGTASVEVGRVPVPEELTIDHCHEVDRP